MRFIWLLGALLVGLSAHAAPPPDASGRYHDWFRRPDDSWLAKYAMLLSR